MNKILPWPSLIKRLRFLLDADQAQLADHLGVDEPTVDRWERGILVPEGQIQKIIRNKLHHLEPAISAEAIEAMPVIAAIHSSKSLSLCCAASQPYAETYEMRADELRYMMTHHMWTVIMEQAADALANNEAWKSGECALVRATIQRHDGHWVRYAGSPIGKTNMTFWIGGLTEKPDDLQKGTFDLGITTLDDLLS